MYSLEIGCRSHIGARSGRGVSVILVSTESLASQSYRCKMWFKCRNHISINGGASVALISVSIGSFCRTHIRHPPIILNDYFSRQKFQALTFFLTGICCILSSIFQAIIADQKILIITFGILAKFAAQSKFFYKLFHKLYYESL